MEEHTPIIEDHPLAPFYPKGARILLLGSFPPPKMRWSINFYYPNWQNDMWRIFGLIFFDDSTAFENRERKMFDEKKIRAFLTNHKIALSDAARRIIRTKGNASDQYLETIEFIDLEQELNRLPDCRILVTAGQKSCDILNQVISKLINKNIESPGIGNYQDFFWKKRTIRWFRMPSSSRAYPKPLSEKAREYRKIFETVLPAKEN